MAAELAKKLSRKAGPGLAALVDADSAAYGFALEQDCLPLALNRWVKEPCTIRPLDSTRDCAAWVEGDVLGKGQDFRRSS